MAICTWSRFGNIGDALTLYFCGDIVGGFFERKKSRNVVCDWSDIFGDDYFAGEADVLEKWGLIFFNEI